MPIRAKQISLTKKRKTCYTDGVDVSQHLLDPIVYVVSSHKCFTILNDVLVSFNHPACLVEDEANDITYNAYTMHTMD